MVREYLNFFKRYLKVSQLKNKYFVFMLLIDIIYKTMQLLMVLFASWIIKYATLGNFDMTWMSLGLLFISYIIYTIFYYLSYIIYGRNMNYTFTTLQTILLHKVMGADDRFAKRVSKGKLLNSIVQDSIKIGDNCNEITEIITTTIQIIAVIIISTFYSIWFGIIMLVYAIIYIVFSDVMTKKYIHYYFKERYQTDKYTSLLSQFLSGLQEIKTFNMLDKLQIKLNVIQRNFSKAYLTKRKYVTHCSNDSLFIVYAFKILLLVMVLIMMIDGVTTVDILILIVGYHDSLTAYIDRLIKGFESIRSTDVSVQRINDILHFSDNSNISYGLINKDDIEGTIEFRNVSFCYNKIPILKSINFQIRPHTITAIVGPSGTGKTSIINLLLRLYKPNDGNILIDGLDIFEYSKEVYSSNVAVVNQKPFVFNMSIRKNLSLVDDNFNHQIEACKRVGIHDFISGLPNGYNTILREDAKNISGGQKQLISLARTLLTGSEILLFDEITSSLDTESSKQIVNVLKELKRDYTIIMITHKPDMMRKADRIIVINDGKIVGDGSHSDLIKENSHYQWLQARKSASKLGVFDSD